MKNKVIEYVRKIEALEKKVSDLERLNEDLQKCLVQNVQFSAKLSNITYEMDCLLVKKGREIRELEKKLEQSLAKVQSDQTPAQDSKIEDFEIDMTCGRDDEIEQPLNLHDHMEIFEFNRPDVTVDSNGFFNCPECKSSVLGNFENHYRGHTNERPFGCKLCQKRFTHRGSCISHIRGHDDRFKLKCTVCAKKFIESKSILRHVKRLHNGKGYERKKRLIKRKRESS